MEQEPFQCSKRSPKHRLDKHSDAVDKLGTDRGALSGLNRFQVGTYLSCVKMRLDDIESGR